MAANDYYILTCPNNNNNRAESGHGINIFISNIPIVLTCDKLLLLGIISNLLLLLFLREKRKRNEIMMD